MASIETIRRITLEARAVGTEEARAKMAALGLTADGAAKSVDAIAIATETSARRQLSAMTAYDRVRQKVDEAYRAQVQLERATSAVHRAFQQGKISASAYADVTAKIQAKYAAATTSGGANSNNRLRSDQIQNLLYQGSDIVSTLGSGSPLTTVALQQGPQIAQTFAGPGGASIRGAFASAMEAASGLAARVGIAGGALGALATAGVAAAAAGLSYASSQRETEKALLGVGRASGVTVGQIAELAAANASAGGVSTRSARELATSYAATGRIGSETIAGLIRTTKDFAATTGQVVPDAAKMLAEAFADPTRGADQLNERLGFLNDTTRETIQRLQAQGDRLAAQRALFDAYTGSLAKASETMSGWGRIGEAVGTTVGNIWDKLGEKIDRVVTGGSLEQQIEAARTAFERAQVAAEGGLGLFSSKDVERAQAALNKLEAQAAKIRTQSDQAQAARNSLTIGNLIRSTQPDVAELKKLQDGAEALRKALAEPSKYNLDMVGLYNAQNAFGNLSRAVQALTEDIDRFGSRAVAVMNRAADFASKTVGYSPTAKSAAEIQERFDQLERVADSRELAGLRRARGVELDTLQRTTYQTTGSYRTNIRDVPDAYRDRIYKAAITQGLDPSFLASVGAQESGNFDPRVVSGQRRSSAGAIGIMQFMPKTAAEYGIEPTNPGQSIDAAALYLRRALDRRNGNEALALADYNAGPGRVNDAGGNISRLPRETQNYIATILTATPQASELAKAQKARTDGLETEQRNLDIANRLLGRNGEAYDAATRAQQMLADAQRQGIPITDDYRAEIDRIAGGMAAANRALANTRLGRDLEFERSQIGRTSEEQSAFSRARSAFGDTDNPAARAAISTSLVNENLRQTKDLARDAFTGFTSDVMRGTTALGALQNALGRIQDKLLNSFADKAISSIFGGLSGSAGVGIDLGFSSWMPKFADGGVCGQSGGFGEVLA